MALFHFVLETVGWAPDPVRLGSVRTVSLPAWVMLGTWCLEAIGLVALFLLIDGRSRASGLLTGWIAWVFRGPLLVLSVAGLGGLPPAPWWSLAFSWWILYSLCGLLLGALSRMTLLPP